MRNEVKSYYRGVTTDIENQRRFLSDFESFKIEDGSIPLTDVVIRVFNASEPLNVAYCVGKMYDVKQMKSESMYMVEFYVMSDILYCDTLIDLLGDHYGMSFFHIHEDLTNCVHETNDRPMVFFGDMKYVLVEYNKVNYYESEEVLVDEFNKRHNTNAYDISEVNFYMEEIGETFSYATKVELDDETKLEAEMLSLDTP